MDALKRDTALSPKRVLYNKVPSIVDTPLIIKLLEPIKVSVIEGVESSLVTIHITIPLCGGLSRAIHVGIDLSSI